MCNHLHSLLQPVFAGRICRSTEKTALRREEDARILCSARVHIPCAVRESSQHSRAYAAVIGSNCGSRTYLIQSKNVSVRQAVKSECSGGNMRKNLFFHRWYSAGKTLRETQQIRFFFYLNRSAGRLHKKPAKFMNSSHTRKRFRGARLLAASQGIQSCVVLKIAKYGTAVKR